MEGVFGIERLVFLNCSFRTDCRLFDLGDRNVEPGFTFDCRMETGIHAFYMVPHTVGEGNALPIHCMIVRDGPGVGANWIKERIFMLCDYGERRIPSPFVYTLRLSELIGIHLKRSTGDCRQLCRELAKSDNWQNLCRSGKPFYL
jgi:hypothetical protein